MEKINELIECINSASENFRVFYENIGIEKYKEISCLLLEILKIRNIDVRKMIVILEECNTYLASENYIRLSDALEYELKPFLLGLSYNKREAITEEQINNIIIIKNFENKKIPIQIKKDTMIHLHSQYSIHNESAKVFEKYFRKNILNYTFIGFGFGYHILKFLYKNLKIKIVILNKLVFELSRENIDIDKFLNSNNVEIVFIEDLESSFEELLQTNKNSIIFHTPSIYIMENGKIKEAILSKHIKYNSFKRFEKLLEDNFQYNIKHACRYLSSFIEEFRNNIVIIVGAGPSLKEDIKFIKKVKSNVKILSVGTALKPLLNNDIVPDAVVITDPQEAVIEQIENVNIGKSLLILDSANKGLVDYWKGEVFLCAQFKNNNISESDIVKSGGSVVTTAVDIVIKARAKMIILSGMDFSYTRELTHVLGAHRSEIIKSTDRKYLRVENYNGSYNKTSRNLLIYKEWISERVKDVKIPIYNITHLGAKIENTKRVNVNKLEKMINKN